MTKNESKKEKKEFHIRSLSCNNRLSCLFLIPFPLFPFHLRDVPIIITQVKLGTMIFTKAKRGQNPFQKTSKDNQTIRTGTKKKIEEGREKSVFFFENFFGHPITVLCSRSLRALLAFVKRGGGRSERGGGERGGFG
jgi:hypothetical protein